MWRSSKVVGHGTILRSINSSWMKYCPPCVDALRSRPSQVQQQSQDVSSRRLIFPSTNAYFHAMSDVLYSRVSVVLSFSSASHLWKLDSASQTSVREVGIWTPFEAGSMWIVNARIFRKRLLAQVILLSPMTSKERRVDPGRSYHDDATGIKCRIIDFELSKKTDFTREILNQNARSYFKR